MSATTPPPEDSGDGQRQQGIAAAIAEVSERASVLIREEVELAKAEIAEKTTRLAKGAIVAIVAGMFFFTALFFVLIGCAWLLYYELPVGNAFTYFWGFFAMAVILVILGVIAGLLAARAVRSGAPPTPQMAIDEARKIRETVSETVSSSAAAARSDATAVSGAARASWGGEGASGGSPPIPVPPSGGASYKPGEASQGQAPPSGAVTGRIPVEGSELQQVHAAMPADGELGEGGDDGAALDG